jgi:uncharacterized membrane protein
MNDMTRATRVTHSIDLPVRAEEAWAVIADYPRDTEWRTGVRSMSAEPPGPVAVGTVTVEHLRFGGRTYRNVARVVGVEPGRSIDWCTTDGADARGRRAVAPLTDASCRVTLELDVRPAGVERLLTPILARMLARNLRNDLTRLGQMLGASAGGREAAGDPPQARPVVGARGGERS